MAESRESEDQQMLSKMAKHFHELVSDKKALRTSVENFLNNVVDELTLGIIFEEHRKYKTGNVYEVDMEKANGEKAAADAEVFTQQDVDKITCVCPNCSRVVAATRFAPHLGNCMGVGRTRSGNATKRTASSLQERKNSSFSEEPSDDKDDMDWNSNKRRKKKKRNGSKKSKSGGIPKTSWDSRASEAIDIEAEDDDFPRLRSLLQGHSNSSSLADSASSSNLNSSKKNAKAGNKKRKRVKASPNSSSSSHSSSPKKKGKARNKKRKKVKTSPNTSSSSHSNLSKKNGKTRNKKGKRARASPSFCTSAD